VEIMVDSVGILLVVKLVDLETDLLGIAEF
jgi:hypothetical protein